MKVPALAARAPLGATKEATGTGEARIALIISRIALSRPPGVSMRSTTSWVPSVAARSIERRTKSAVAGAIPPVSGHDGDRRGEKTARPAQHRRQQEPHVTTNLSH